jgi:hypothetical protein
MRHKNRHKQLANHSGANLNGLHFMKADTMKIISTFHILPVLGLSLFFTCLSLEVAYGDQTNENINFPEFPEKIDLTQEFQLAQHFQEFSVLYHNDQEFRRIHNAIYKKENFILSLLEKPDVISIINDIRPWWKTKWGVELPLWDKNTELHYYRIIRHAIYENKISHDIGNRLGIPPLADLSSWEMTGTPPMKSVFGNNTAIGSMGGGFVEQNNEDDNTVIFGNATYVVSDFFPRPLYAVFISKRPFPDKIYLVACYQSLDENAHQKEKLDGNSIRLRYLFMGCQPEKLYQGGSIYSPLTRNSFPASAPINSNFSPTGSIIFFDELGHPTRYHSVKDGKYFGHQIQWDNKGSITDFSDVTEAARSCADIWLEFTRK